MREGNGRPPGQKILDMEWGGANPELTDCAWNPTGRLFHQQEEFCPVRRRIVLIHPTVPSVHTGVALLLGTS
jgi:hypothetical protein